MSNIYIQEPPTNGKVLLVTTVGDIDIELWSKEAPKAARNFVQLCMEGYYDGTIFHRVIRDFIVQGGDPTGSGHGGESIYGKPFKDEFHQRLRFVRRGLVAMANAGPNDNGSQFFFTMGSTPELMNKHTIFGKVSGNTVYNMLKLQECETGPEDRPVYPNKILKTQVLANPYDDIVPRVVKRSKKDGDLEKKSRSKSKATKNFKLLSFGEEAEEDEEQVTKVSEGWKGKGKSSHELTNDPRLSSVPAVDISPEKTEKRKADSSDIDSEEEKEKEERRESIKKKLKKEPPEKNINVKQNKHSPDSVSNKQPATVQSEPAVKAAAPRKSSPPTSKPTPTSKTIPVEKPSNRSEELKQEARTLKREIRESKKREQQRKMEVKEEVVEEEPQPVSNDPLADFKRERLKYKALRKEQGKKGLNREEITLSILNKFKTKLEGSRKLAGRYSDDEDKDEDLEDDATDLSWMHHKLQFEEEGKKKVLDANIHDVDRYEIHDPRNPLTKRRREESKQKMKDRR
ncbi:spliceosome-associated protein CWC27 homolog [Mercenaria mercenaria]|uniref:spliceosome-associated protein CWC27 homolog n=1 Tax=Mercenaria mercenaria TaxID=6596 RepID=UPI00234F8785|nr:spliceosome-associated protein CWC27 homolog [Mercenaria mercenaria]